MDGKPGEVEYLLLVLQKRKWNMAVAESCTGGLLSAEIVKVSGASKTFLGGCVAYSNSAKNRILGVPQEMLLRGAATFETAEAMARGAAEAFGSDVGLAVTGAAGPDPMDGVVPGEVYVCVVWPGGMECRKYLLQGTRQEIMTGAAEAAVSLACAALRGYCGQ